jgi:hypothetical protein
MKKNIVQREPVVTAATVAGLIVTAASIFNVVLDLSTVQTVVTAVLPLALAFIARQKVTPVP